MLAKENKLKSVFISNGYINEKPLRELAPYLDAANIDLKAFSDETYKKICGGCLQPVLENLLILKEKNIWIEITSLLIPGITDNPESIETMCNWLVKNNFHDYPIHFSKFVPLYKLSHLTATIVSDLEEAYKIAHRAGMKYTYLGNVQGHQNESTFCPHCNEKIIERIGYKISSNKIKNNSCSFCNEKISGIW